MRRRDFLHKRSLLRFHDGLAWLMQILMFLTLGLQVYPSKLPAVAGVGLAVALFLMFVARPAATVLTLLPARVSWREQALIAWVGLRGAAPIILATFPLVGGVAGAELIFELVFFIVLMSALVQGTSLPWVARRLGLATGSAAGDVDPIDLVATAERDLVQVQVRDGSPAAGRRLMDLHLPKGSLVVVVERSGLSLVPSGSTQLQAGDRMVVLAAHQDRAAVKALGAS
jgi:cell volume regulation protein A